MKHISVGTARKMKVRVGLTGNDLKSLVHDSLHVSSKDMVWVTTSGEKGVSDKQSELCPGQVLSVSVRGPQLLVTGLPQLGIAVCSRVRVAAKTGVTSICLQSLRRPVAGGVVAPCYHGELELSAVGSKVQAVAICDLEDYVRGVLGSEIPGSYKLEAIKAQAVSARTYGLYPRISHEAQGFTVCDSYLCCQYFAGITSNITLNHKQAIEETKGEILTYQGKPALALFSSCAGGHTESYENCFSDPLSGQFPPEPIAYLKGVAEGKLSSAFPQEAGLRELWRLRAPQTVDAWSPHFRWQVTLTADVLEGHMHHAVETMRQAAEFASFIVAPPSNSFGHINSFEITNRGVSGVAVAMKINTSKGQWLIRKELVIRSVFKNPEVKLERLKSARIFFDYKKDKLGLLSCVAIYGLGWGHGVGLQQTGAEGLARQGKSYKEILSHYFQGAVVQVL
ncbi:MAG: SpoIID/LytB domain-containing protein [Candidatus Melainabacteria bacterium]|nr:SpoIID/LytB domain-containing protein [Candidatus Melainabacteria bacterium]